MKPEARVLEITSATKKISLNYHLNKFSQFGYYILDVKCDFYHVLLRDNSLIFINVTLLPSCLSVLSEHVTSQSICLVQFLTFPLSSRPHIGAEPDRVQPLYGGGKIKERSGTGLSIWQTAE